MAQLTLRTGLLGKRLAAHLLRRTTYRVTPSRIEEFALKTAEEAVEALIQPASLLYPEGPLYWENGQPIFPLGDTVGGQITAAATNSSGNLSYGRLRGPYDLWRIYECIDCPTAHWKITQWFASLFVLDSRAGVRFHYHFWRLLHHLAFDNLNRLALKVTTDNNMLTYLDNRHNRVGRPNENYAREFLELFTILKGETIGVGNYTNYTEADISEAAKVLTGFITATDYADPETGIAAGKAHINRHDKADKTFSSAFQGKTIVGATTAEEMYRELQEFIDMVFEQQETARAYVRKMYRYFVGDALTQEIEQDIIAPLAAELHQSGYQHIPVLKQLLKSQHFYDEDDSNSQDEILGSKLKSPLELFCHSVNLWDIENTDRQDLKKHFSSNYSRIAHEHFTTCGMPIRGPITVEGFPGYYDGPGYSRNWFNTNILYQRYTYGISFRRGKVRETNNHFPYRANLVKWVEDFVEDPAGPGTPQAPIGASDSRQVVQKTLEYFLPELPLGDRYAYFEQRLLGGLSPINWYFSWVEYKNTGDDANVKVALERFYDAIMTSPEYQTF